MPIITIEKSKMKNNIKKMAFIGMMGSGKTSVVQAFSKFHQKKCFDLDFIFEKKYGKISDFFKNYGEETFRKKETELLEEVIKNDEFVLSTGGGIILSEKNREILFRGDICTIYLSANPDTIYERIKNDTTRPLLIVKNPKEEIRKILENRKKFYKLANIEIKTDNKNIDEIVKEITEKL